MSGATPDEGTPIAEGMYSYTVDDRSRAAELWRLRRLADGRQHMQALLGVGQRIVFGMDLLMDADGRAVELQGRAQGAGDVGRQVTLHWRAGQATGEILSPEGQTPLRLDLPPGAALCPEAIATRLTLWPAINPNQPGEQVIPLCLVPALDPHRPALVPEVVTARLVVLGAEPVELLMATVTATHVALSLPNQPPQHAWFDAHGMPVRWTWIGPVTDGGADAQHEFSLTRYARFTA